MEKIVVYTPTTPEFWEGGDAEEFLKVVAGDMMQGIAAEAGLRVTNVVLEPNKLIEGVSWDEETGEEFPTYVARWVGEIESV